MWPRSLLLLCLLVTLVGVTRCAYADVDHKTVAEMEALDADKETISGAFPGVLVSVRGDFTLVDAKYTRPYHAVCSVFEAERTAPGDPIRGYGRRFKIFVPERESLPLAKRVARMLLLLWGENHERMRFDHPRDNPVVNVYLTRLVGAGLSPDTGGEQFDNNIYLYDIVRDRSATEWAREIAHEYGHYALPGISGFSAPESWANGMLGERLFFKWIGEDLKARRLRPEEIPFLSPEQLETYLTLQVNPLVRRILREGVQPKELEKRDGEGMDYYTGVALTIDTLYGSKMLLNALAATRSPDSKRFPLAPDFLHGFQEALRDAPAFAVTLPVTAKDSTMESFMLYLPPGEYAVTMEDPLRSWQFANGKGLRRQGQEGLSVTQADWRKISVNLTPPVDKPVRLLFHRKDAH